MDDRGERREEDTRQLLLRVHPRSDRRPENELGLDRKRVATEVITSPWAT